MRKTVKRIVALFLAGTIALELCSCSNRERGDLRISDDGSITQDYFFDSSDPDSKGYGYPEEVTYNGKKFVITGYIDTQVIDSRKVLEKTVDIQSDSIEDVPAMQTVEIGDRKISAKVGELTDLQYEVPVRKTVRHSQSFEDCFTSPSQIPSVVDFTVEDRGEEKTVEGTLVSFEQISDYAWRTGRTVTGIWEAPGGTRDAYVLEGTDIRIPYDRTSPTWSGYENDIIRCLGLPSSNWRVTGGSWVTGEYTSQNGTLSRQAEYYTEIYSADYRRTYEAEFDTVAGLCATGHLWIEENEAERNGIPMEDDLESGLKVKDVYTIKAVVRYTLMETDLPD